MLRLQIRRYATLNNVQARHPRLSARLVPSPESETWLTRKVQNSRAWAAFFNAAIFMLGYSSTTQTAASRNYHLYAHACARAPERNVDFWVNHCHLPPTFQSYFLIANIHVWLLTTRLRALPHTAHVQTLVDHFFIDIEDRIRMILRPPPAPVEPYTLLTTFYPEPLPSPQNKRRGGMSDKAPETLVSRQMKVFRDQWQGMWVSLDYAMVAGDEHMAAAIWRNVLGARGAHGIVSENEPPTASDPFPPETIKKGASLASHGAPPLPIPFSSYPAFPELALALTRYIRRELRRLENIPDSVFLKDDVPSMCRKVAQWGPIPYPDPMLEGKRERTEAEKSQGRDLMLLDEAVPPKPEDKYGKVDLESDLRLFGKEVKKERVVRG